jgi:hypothetical protein
MLLLGCKPEGRHTEQHDVLFGIGNSLSDLKPQIEAFWPEAKDRIHLDAWREVTSVNGYQIEVSEKNEPPAENAEKLFFINLGGYTKGLFAEQHYILLSVNDNIAAASKCAKGTFFYQENNFPGAESHIDDKYAVDVDDVYNVEDILPSDLKEKYTIKISKNDSLPDDEMHLGYFKMSKL